MSLHTLSNEKSKITFSGNSSRTFPVKNSDRSASQAEPTPRAECRLYLAGPRGLAVPVLRSAPMHVQPQRPPDAEKFSRSAQMVERLRRDVLYTEKRVRDRLFTAMEMALAQAPTPPILSRLTRDAANYARREAQRDVFVFSNWEIAARAVSNAMLGARTFLAPGGALEPGLRAQATVVTALQDGFRDLTEIFLLEFLIARLGDVSSRDHVALAHALFRQFDSRVPLADLEDRVVLLLASLHDRITLREDGTYSLLYQPMHAATV